MQGYLPICRLNYDERDDLQVVSSNEVVHAHRHSTSLHTGTPEGITFDVSDVLLAETPLPTVKTQNAVATLLGGKVEVACDYTDNSACLRRVGRMPNCRRCHLDS